jgi:hypothetical protein
MSAVFLDYATVDDGDLDPTTLQASAPGLRFLANTSQADVIEAIRDCEIVLLNKLKITAEVMAASPKLRLIALSATGTNNIDVVAAADRDAVQAQARAVLALVAQLEAACDELSTLAYDLVPDEVALGNLLETVPEFDALRAELRRLRDNGDEFETEDEREQR